MQKKCSNGMSNILRAHTCPKMCFKYIAKKIVYLTLERSCFQTIENDPVRQLTHYVHKLYFVHLFDQGDIFKDEISFVAP